MWNKDDEGQSKCTRMGEREDSKTIGVPSSSTSSAQFMEDLVGSFGAGLERKSEYSGLS